MNAARIPELGARFHGPPSGSLKESEGFCSVMGLLLGGPGAHTTRCQLVAPIYSTWQVAELYAWNLLPWVVEDDAHVIRGCALIPNSI